MKQAKNPAVLVATIVILAAIGYLYVSLSHGAGTALSVNPSGGKFVDNTTITVAVRLDTAGESVNAVQANLSYSSDKLDFVSVSNTGSAFPYEAENQGGDGIVKIARSISPGGQPVNGDALVATITFKVKVASGAGTIVFLNSSGVARSNGDGINILSGTTGANYTFSAPAIAPNPPISPLAPAPSPSRVNPPTTPAPKSAPKTPTSQPTPPPASITRATPSPLVNPTSSAALKLPTNALCQLTLADRLKPFILTILIIIAAVFIILGGLRWKMAKDIAKISSPLKSARLDLSGPPQTTTIYPQNYQHPLPENPTLHQQQAQPIVSPQIEATPSASPAILAIVLISVISFGIYVVHPGSAAIKSNTNVAQTCLHS